MERYANLSRNSGVVGYDIGDEFISVRFSDGSVYRYTFLSAGRQNVEAMKGFATSGIGLNTFINKNVRNRYDSKMKGR